MRLLLPYLFSVFTFLPAASTASVPEPAPMTASAFKQNSCCPTALGRSFTIVKNLAIPQEPPGGGKNSSSALLTDTLRQAPLPPRRCGVQVHLPRHLCWLLIKYSIPFLLSLSHIPSFLLYFFSLAFSWIVYILYLFAFILSSWPTRTEHQWGNYKVN